MVKKINGNFRLKHIYLFECCILTKGHLRSIIIDTQRDNFYFIPNDLYSLLTEYQGEQLELMLEKGGKENKNVILEYIKFLIKNELIYLSDEKIPLSKISKEYNYPFPVQNVIIDLRSEMKVEMNQVLADLESLFTAHVQFRIYDNTEQLFHEVIQCIGKNTFERIEIIVNYTDEATYMKMKEKAESNPYISVLKVYNYPEKIKKINSSRLTLYNHSFSSHADCGAIDPDYFMTRLYHVIEGKGHNTCLYKKISIDENGYVRHCPSMKKNYGKYSKKNLLKALNDHEYLSKSNLTKKEINICKVCEFREICTDCRAHISDPEDIFSKPIKCKYDPYTATWS